MLTQSGIGKVNAAISTTLLIEKFNPKLIINTGSAGALDESLSVGDMLINDVVYHEITKSVETVINKNYNAKIGQIVSGDSFIGSVDQRQQLNDSFLRLWLLKWRQLQLHKLAINFMFLL